jgi:transcriptional regulator with GAF, ATPase, and Fis domain
MRPGYPSTITRSLQEWQPGDLRSHLGIIGGNRALRHVLAQASQVAEAGSTVLLLDLDRIAGNDTPLSQAP